MMKIQLLNVKAEKRLYLVEVKNERGEIKDCWLSKDDIDFFHPGFIDRFQSDPSANDLTPVSPVVIAPPSNESPPNGSPLSIPSPIVSRSTNAMIIPPLRANVPQPIVSAKSSQTNQLMYCEHCGMGFKRRDHIKDHILKQHCGEKLQLQCPKCSRVYGYKSNLSQHLRRTHKLKSDKALKLATEVDWASSEKSGKWKKSTKSKKTAASKNPAPTKKPTKAEKRKKIKQPEAVQTKELEIRLHRLNSDDTSRLDVEDGPRETRK